MSERQQSNDTLPTTCKLSPDVLGQIRVWILQGATEHDISEAIADKWPDVDSKPAIIATMEQISKTANFDQESLVGFCIESTRYLYQRMVEVGDFPGALRAVKQLSEYARRPIVIDCDEET